MVKKQISAPIVIIGAGIAGLCVSFYLTKSQIPHIIIEKGEVANRSIEASAKMTAKTKQFYTGTTAFQEDFSTDLDYFNKYLLFAQV